MVPSKEQIEAEARRIATALGGGVHLRGSDVAGAVDAKFPGMSDAEYAEVRQACIRAADAIRFAALSAMWSDAE